MQGKFGLAQKIDEVGFKNCYLSEITIAELLYGAENSKNIKRHLNEVEKVEQTFKIIPVYNILKTYAATKVKLRRKGNLISEFDLLIGSTALAKNLIMVTGNENHFKKIKDIQIENWTKKKFNAYV